MLRSGTSLLSATYHVGTQNSRYLRTYILLVPYDFTKANARLTCLGIKNNWTDGTKPEE